MRVMKDNLWWVAIGIVLLVLFVLTAPPVQPPTGAISEPYEGDAPWGSEGISRQDDFLVDYGDVWRPEGCYGFEPPESGCP